MSSDGDASLPSERKLRQEVDQLADGEEADKDLFGSGSETERVSNRQRKLSDSELDSGDDEGRNDRTDDAIHNDDERDTDGETRQANVLAASIGRHSDPKPSDGELYLLQLPNSIGIEPKCFTLKDFQPPQTDHHSSSPPSATFSAYQTSLNTVRWRHAPNDNSKLQSNCRILRWSDGSLTLQLASNPCEQFELVAKSLAAPQINPKKATPTSVSRAHAISPQPYNHRLDSHTYLIAPHEPAELLRVTNQITASLAVQSSSDQHDEALARLQMQLAAAQKGNKANPDGGLTVININEDPELQKKRAEVAEKEKMKMQRRLESQRERENNRNNNILRKSGLRPGGMSGGLTVGGLEDDGGLTGTVRGRAAKPKRAKPRRRNSEYSDESDFHGRGRTREDEYDEGDGFLVGSDEEPEVEEASEEEADMGDIDAEGDEEEVEEEPERNQGRPRRDSEERGAGRGKRRRVVMDEDEED